MGINSNQWEKRILATKHIPEFVEWMDIHGINWNAEQQGTSIRISVQQLVEGEAVMLPIFVTEQQHTKVHSSLRKVVERFQNWRTNQRLRTAFKRHCNHT